MKEMCGSSSDGARTMAGAHTGHIQRIKGDPPLCGCIVALPEKH